MKRMSHSLLLGLSLLYVAVGTTFAQPNNLLCGIEKNNSQQPVVYITYIKKEWVKNNYNQRDRELLIKLTNNAKCNIQLLSPGEPMLAKPLEFVRDENGKVIRLVSRPDRMLMPAYFLPNGKYQIFYDYRNQKGKSIQAGGSDGCLLFSWILKSGESIFFNASSVVFQKNPILNVNYSFEGDTAPLARYSMQASLNLKGIKLRVVDPSKLKKVN